MLKRAFAAATVGAAIALPVVVVAQPAGTDTQVQADPNSESGASYRATALLDANVRGEDGQVLAEVEDFVLDSQSNQVQYVVLAYGNVQAEDAQYYVVPASQFFVQREADVIYLQTPLTVDVIKRAPAFRRAEWVNVVRQPNWYVGVNQFWTGVGVNVGVNRGFGRRGQINAIDAGALDNPNRPGANRPDRPGPRPGRPGAGNLNDPNVPNPRPDRPDAPGANPDRPDRPGNLNPDRPGAPSPDRPDRPNPGAPDRPGANPGAAPGAGNPPGPGSAPGAPAPPSAPGAGAGAGANAGAGVGAGGIGAGAGAGVGGNAGAGAGAPRSGR